MMRVPYNLPTLRIKHVIRTRILRKHITRLPSEMSIYINSSFKSRGSNVSYVWVTKGVPLQRLNSKLVNFKTVERKVCNRKRFNVVLLLLFFIFKLVKTHTFRTLTNDTCYYQTNMHLFNFLLQVSISMFFNSLACYAVYGHGSIKSGYRA